MVGPLLTLHAATAAARIILIGWGVARCPVGGLICAPGQAHPSRARRGCQAPTTGRAEAPGTHAGAVTRLGTAIGEIQGCVTRDPRQRPEEAFATTVCVSDDVTIWRSNTYSHEQPTCGLLVRPTQVSPESVITGAPAPSNPWPIESNTGFYCFIMLVDPRRPRPSDLDCAVSHPPAPQGPRGNKLPGTRITGPVAASLL